MATCSHDTSHPHAHSHVSHVSIAAVHIHGSSLPLLGTQKCQATLITRHECLNHAFSRLHPLFQSSDLDEPNVATGCRLMQLYSRP